MITVSADAAETYFESLIDRLINGEEVVITKEGTAVARIVPIGATLPSRNPGVDADCVDGAGDRLRV